MAAVAAEPGAAAVSTITASVDEEGPPEQGLGGPLHAPSAQLENDGTQEYGPVVELVVPCVEDGGDGEERRHVRPELQPAAGKAFGDNDELLNKLPVDRTNMDRFSPGPPGEPEVGGTVSVQAVYRSILAGPQPSAVFLHSFPASPSVTEAGLSLAEPAEPTTNVTTDRAETGQDRGYTALVKTELRPDTSEDGATNSQVAEPGYDINSTGSEELSSRDLRDSSPPCRSPKRRLVMDTVAMKMEKNPGDESSSRVESFAAEVGFDASSSRSVEQLRPGSEVRVSLDHVIDDALVVSFRVGEKVFSGVLMDVSKRFGPYGIPITVFPRRNYKDRLQPSMQSRQEEEDKQEAVTINPPPPPEPWRSKLPPLFQEGAPYPPPLFIRDTYNQALPQPPPRKIKRPKRRYRCEEPTSIMNAIKLRPRQVLCDKCKGVVSTGGPREVRRVPVGSTDLRGEETSRRRRPADGPISTEVKRLRSDRDEKGGRNTAERRSSGIKMSSSSSSRRVLKGASSSSSSSPTSSRVHLKLNSKKVLAKGSAVDRSKARQVLKKLARNSQPTPHRQPKDQNHDQEHAKAVTRATALQSHNQKVHFTRRLQHLSAATAGSSPYTALPPRMRLKPQSTAAMKGC
ncbi:hypothetical protein LDENG_00141480 [Lucifuga dentata]|nr:hypothetical protein LDENG_00141480 [Lucifuga dentata]